MDETATSLDLVPSIAKDSLNQRTELLLKKPSSGRKPYVPPKVEDLGTIESTTFQTSIILQ